MSTEIQQRLLNDYQRDFPLVTMPYAKLATDLGLAEHEVLDHLAALKEAGSVSRVGAVLRPGSVGAGTLAALQVPTDQLPKVAQIVNDQQYVNHNYQRDHDLNMWFVVTAPDRATVTTVLQDIERQTGLKVMDFPMVRDYFIDLGFDLTGRDNRPTPCRASFNQAMLDVCDHDLLQALEKGLALTSRPWALLAEAVHMTETAVLARLRYLQDQDIIRRLGVIVRHHELGYNANAMTVWQVAPGDIDVMGRRLGSLPYVRLCYQRRAHANWPYTLYAMIHGKDRDVVLRQIEDAREACGLQDIPSETLFSVKRFKQTGGRYLKADQKSDVAAA
jgi:siroheme decarboxylase